MKAGLTLPAVILSTLAFGSISRAGGAERTDCPAVIKAAIDKAFPKATITRCTAEREHGHDQFEVALTKNDRSRAEVDVSPDGKILQVEERIALDKVPAAVIKAFAARYPKAKVDAAEKQTPSSGSVTYELGFTIGATRKEATFTEAGKFVEEE